ncbi:MAG TPA: flagellar hook basal-body protein [Pirellulaceae bacterium]|nr:flagellar hook basal-body protein [Pirellulaceae bacterium]
MSLNSVMQTALSGMQAATASVGVTAHNLANLQTAGFERSRVQLATLPLGGGVMVSAIVLDPAQGPIASGDQLPLLALEGEGLFILEGDGGERLFTQGGRFSLNAAGELVTAGGDRVLGYGLDTDGQIDRSELSPLTIRLGSQVASAGGRAATLQSYSITRGGRIVGRYSDGVNRTLGQLRLARFSNPAGLTQRAGNRFQATAASGEPRESDPGEAGAGEVVAAATELSNVDLGRQLIELTLANQLFRANAAVFRTADEMLGEMFFPWRR